MKVVELPETSCTPTSSGMLLQEFMLFPGGTDRPNRHTLYPALQKSASSPRLLIGLSKFSTQDSPSYSLPSLFITPVLMHWCDGGERSASSFFWRRHEDVAPALRSLILKMATLCQLTELESAELLIGITYKLIASGLEKTYVKWIENYLTGRTASVRLGAVQSETVPITWGLPQRAVLSPLLFNIMLSDLIFVDGVQLIIYADNITILSKGDYLTEVRACFQRYLDTLATWFKKYKLIVNPAKCSQQIFTKKHSIPEAILQLNNSVVQNVETVEHFLLNCDNYSAQRQPPWSSGLRPVLGTRSLLRADRPRVRNPAMNTSCSSFRTVSSHLSHIRSEENQPSFVTGGGVEDTPTGAAALIADSSLVYPSHE
ncbi:Reverse transcriptase domain [Trinorchestia longiramus]|nr:Reverse transcriptase domain [Trinorchestia longiramus]